MSSIKDILFGISVLLASIALATIVIIVAYFDGTIVALLVLLILIIVWMEIIK